MRLFSDKEMSWLLPFLISLPPRIIQLSQSSLQHLLCTSSEQVVTASFTLSPLSLEQAFSQVSPLKSMDHRPLSTQTLRLIWCGIKTVVCGQEAEIHVPGLRDERYVDLDLRQRVYLHLNKDLFMPFFEHELESYPIPINIEEASMQSAQL